MTNSELSRVVSNAIQEKIKGITEQEIKKATASFEERMKEVFDYAASVAVKVSLIDRPSQFTQELSVHLRVNDTDIKLS